MMSWTLVKGMQLVHLRIFSLEFLTAKFSGNSIFIYGTMLPTASLLQPEQHPQR